MMVQQLRALDLVPPLLCSFHSWEVCLLAHRPAYSYFALLILIHSYLNSHPTPISPMLETYKTAQEMHLEESPGLPACCPDMVPIDTGLEGVPGLLTVGAESHHV